MLAPLVQLGDVVNLIGGGTPSKSNEGFYDGDIPWATVRDMKQEQLSETEFKISAEAVKKSSTNIIEAGNIITATRVGLGKVCVLQQDTAINQDLKALIPKDDRLDKQYLFWWLKSVAHVIEAAGTGATVKGVKIPFVKALEIPLPSIPEQKRIVAILDQAFADIDKARALTEKSLKNARELFESYLQQVFSQRGEGWEVRPLESFSTIVNGFAFKSGDFSPNNHVKSIKITNVGVYEFVEETDNYLPQQFLESHCRYKAYEGDVVVALTRTIISSGLKVAVVPSAYDGALVNQRVAAVQVDESVIPKKMLQAYLSTKMAIDYVRSNVNELMQPNLSIKDLKQFPIPVPPLDKTASVMDEISKLRESTKKLESIYMGKLNQLDELKKSLLKKAFAGELTKDSEEAAA